MEDINSWHEPAMLEQVLFFLDCKSDGFYVDGTLGGGGHAEAILKKSSPKGKLLGIDRDSTSLEFAKKRLQFFDNRVHIFHGCFSNLPDFLEKAGRKSVDGILLDLGVSSHQLDNALRGFSIKNDGDLDMRMDQSMAASAYDIINQTDEAGLEYIISTFGEERYARSISSLPDGKTICRTNSLGSFSRLSTFCRMADELTRISSICDSSTSMVYSFTDG